MRKRKNTYPQMYSYRVQKGNGREKVTNIRDMMECRDQLGCTPTDVCHYAM